MMLFYIAVSRSLSECELHQDEGLPQFWWDSLIAKQGCLPCHPQQHSPDNLSQVHATNHFLIPLHKLKSEDLNPFKETAIVEPKIVDYP